MIDSKAVVDCFGNVVRNLKETIEGTLVGPSRVVTAVIIAFDWSLLHECSN